MYETMDELEDAVRRQLYRMRDLSDGMAAIRVRETSPDGTVTAEVDGNGSLLNLELSESIAAGPLPGRGREPAGQRGPCQRRRQVRDLLQPRRRRP
jgi:hypothetical protein